MPPAAFLLLWLVLEPVEDNKPSTELPHSHPQGHNVQLLMERRKNYVPIRYLPFAATAGSSLHNVILPISLGKQQTPPQIVATTPWRSLHPPVFPSSLVSCCSTPSDAASGMQTSSIVFGSSNGECPCGLGRNICYSTTCAGSAAWPLCKWYQLKDSVIFPSSAGAQRHRKNVESSSAIQALTVSSPV